MKNRMIRIILQILCNNYTGDKAEGEIFWIRRASRTASTKEMGVRRGERGQSSQRFDRSNRFTGMNKWKDFRVSRLTLMVKIKSSRVAHRPISSPMYTQPSCWKITIP